MFLNVGLLSNVVETLTRTSVNPIGYRRSNLLSEIGKAVGECPRHLTANNWNVESRRVVVGWHGMFRLQELR